MKVEVTRHTKVGFGYSTMVVPGDNGGTKIALPEAPIHVGTVSQVSSAMNADPTLKALRSGGTYMRTAWFIKVGKKWHRAMPFQCPYVVSDLLQTFPVTGAKDVFLFNAVPIEVEDTPIS